MWIRLLLLCALFASLATEAQAGCCNVVKLDPEAAPMRVRVCEAGAGGACGTQLFEGDLALGELANVCTIEPTVVYQERSVAGGEYGPPVTALCDGSDVEI